MRNIPLNWISHKFHPSKRSKIFLGHPPPLSHSPHSNPAPGKTISICYTGQLHFNRTFSRLCWKSDLMKCVVVHLGHCWPSSRFFCFFKFYIIIFKNWLIYRYMYFVNLCKKKSWFVSAVLQFHSHIASVVGTNAE